MVDVVDGVVGEAPVFDVDEVDDALESDVDDIDAVVVDVEVEVVDIVVSHPSTTGSLKREKSKFYRK